MAAIAQWIRLRLPSCGPRFRSHAQHLRIIQFVIELRCEKDKNKQERGRDGPYYLNIETMDH